MNWLSRQTGSGPPLFRRPSLLILTLINSILATVENRQKGAQTKPVSPINYRALLTAAAQVLYHGRRWVSVCGLDLFLGALLPGGVAHGLERMHRLTWRQERVYYARECRTGLSGRISAGTCLYTRCLLSLTAWLWLKSCTGQHCKSQIW